MPDSTANTKYSLYNVKNGCMVPVGKTSFPLLQDLSNIRYELVLGSANCAKLLHCKRKMAALMEFSKILSP